MREVISVHVGQCGNLIGYKFFEVICSEHGINPQGKHCGEDDAQLMNINVYYREEENYKYVPRAVLVDMEDGTFDAIKALAFGTVFDPNSFVAGANGAGKNWAKGYYNEGLELSAYVLNQIRREAEDCECLQGFQIIHSIGGGTGSGQGSLLLERIRDEYPDPIISSHTVIPSPQVSDVVVEPYNAILSINALIEFTDMTFTIDNEALYNIGIKILKKRQPTFTELNHIVVNTLSGITTSFRFPCQLNSSLRKLAVNMVPFPRLHFLVPSYAPLTGDLSVNELIMHIFEPRNMMADIDPRRGKYFTVGALFRGKISTKQVETQICQIRYKNSAYFVDWILDNIKIAVCDISPLGHHKTATAFLNTSAIYDVFERLHQRFSRMYARKAFLQWYLGENMLEDDFHVSDFNMQNLLDEYHTYQDAAASDAGSSTSNAG